MIPASTVYKSIAGRYRPVSYPDGPITARYRFINNASWDKVNESWIMKYRQRSQNDIMEFESLSGRKI